jgi:hypothetical protein
MSYLSVILLLIISLSVLVLIAVNKDTVNDEQTMSHEKKKEKVA